MILPHFPLMLRSFEYHRSGPLSNIVPVVIAIRSCCPAGVAVVVVVVRVREGGVAVAVAGVCSVAVAAVAGVAAVKVAFEDDAVALMEVGRMAGSGE